MTSDARELPSDAKGEKVLAAIVRSVIEAGRLLGFEPERFTADIGLTPRDFEDPDGLVPFESYLLAWEAIERAPGSADFGLRLGRLSSPRLLGALGYAMIHAPDALAAIHLFKRFRRLVSDTLAPEVDIDDQFVTYHLVWPERVARIVQFADNAFVGMLALFRELIGLPEGEALAAEAHFQCPRPAGVDRASVLGCPVRFDAPETRFALHRAPLERPLPRTDPGIFAYLERHAQAVAERLPSASAADRVRRLITEGLASGEPAQAELGKKLGWSERTLQRRLREEGTTFAEILDGVRRELSARYLSEPNVAAFEVAFLLGYSEPSAFHRAFRRWNGVTPQEFRRRKSA